ncbi:MAG TPA: hemerythrin domain-containing protein [Stellaceae bacterium]|nr:hemerythrin domain-containing protein [Stellaceae bacterium]
MPDFARRRRRLMLSAGITGAGMLLFPGSFGHAIAAEKSTKKGEEKEVGAVEDLMREHGVLRRALLVYIETMPKLRANPASVDAAAIARTAKLLRSFGEDYHERKLEEAHIFPALRKAGGPGAAYVDVLIAQHNRGREITDYILAVSGKGTIAAGDAEPLARVFETFVLMYQNHAAREDTIVFPAWKEALSERQLREMGDLFEDIERQTFGKDGFENTVKEIGQIEQSLGFADLAQFTAPPPPKSS